MSPKPSNGNVWDGVLSKIRSQISEQQFETWFRGVKAGPCSEELLEIRVPNSFSREWLRKKYSDVILRVLEQSHGRRPALRFVVQEPGSGDGLAVADEPSLPAPPEVPDGYPESALKIAPSPRVAPPSVRPVGGFMNPRYRLDTFVVGAGNRLPFAAAQATVERDTRLYNPLYVHGGVGAGKSHLLQAMCQGILEARPGTKVLYVPCELFINHFIAAVDKGDIERFRKRYRDVDVLALDDVQFLSQKERSQEEFFHTFNSLYSEQKQIIVAADAAPGDIPGLSDRLLSRFKGGMVCALEPADFETRLGIVNRHAERLATSLPEEVGCFIAENIRSNARELEGAVTRVIGHASLTGVPVSLEVARNCLQDLIAARRRRVTLDHITKAVTAHFGVRLAELQSKRRTQAVTVPRQVCMYLARRLTGLSLEDIGGFFGGRDHSTVLYGVERVGKKGSKDPQFKALVEHLGAQALCEAAS